MHNALEAKIYLRCPILFRHRSLGPQANLMCFGFEHDDGWFEIVYNASKEIEQIAKRMKDEGIEEHYVPSVSQVKEKHGTLEFYVHNLTKEIDDIIEKAEALSEVTCESCGQPGKLIMTGWHRTLCQSCEQNYQSSHEK
jgi:hypothetical protein